MFLVFLLFALFASLFTLQKDTLQYVEPLFLVGSRMSFAGLLLLAYNFYQSWRQSNWKPWQIKAPDWLWFLGLGLLNIYLTNAFEIMAISFTFSAKVCLVYSLSPFLAALAAFILLREKLTGKQWLGMFIGLLGLTPIIFNKPQSELAVLQPFLGGWISLAELLALGAATTSVVGWIILKKLVGDKGYSFTMANGISMLIGGLLAMLHSYLKVPELWQPLPIFALKPYLINSLLMCLISNIICYNLYGYLLKRFSATFMAFAGLVTPMFAVSFGWLFLNESITWHYPVAVAIFSVGLSIFYRDEKIKIRSSLLS